METTTVLKPRRIDFELGAGVTLAADVFGADRLGVVILAHGGGQTRHSWAGAAQKLAAEGWEVIALDLRGHGDSSWAPGGDYGIERFAADLVEVARRQRRGAHLVGASLGGLAGLVAETQVAPGVFRSLTLVDIVPRMEPTGVARIMGFMAANLEQGFESLEAAAEAIAAYVPHRPRPTDLSGLRKNLRLGDDGRYRWHWDPSFASGVRRDRTEEGMAALEERAARIQIPVHLIRGRLSELVSSEAARAFIERIPGGVLTDVAGAAHMIAGDRNDRFTDAVLSFLSRVAELAE
ncbi:alpha/beta fold hydrolase [Phenylobacterium sp. VNQ135]|uniref:alpha/beta fold hydrolase n=1 Tax=Phenylobacterium sp. VNQ135 TaxID=3400922 RepID=UPI003C09734D